MSRKLRKIDDGYRALRLRRETYDRLVHVRAVIAARGSMCLPEGLRMDVETLSDVVDLMVETFARTTGLGMKGVAP